MYGMATWLLGLMLWMQVGMYRIAVAPPDDRPTGGLLAGSVVMTAAVLAGVYWLNRVVRRRIDAWESSQRT
jgi:hypothetical protein